MWYGTRRKGARRPPKDKSVSKNVSDPPKNKGAVKEVHTAQVKLDLERGVM